MGAVNPLVTAWAAWLAAGLVLSFWYYRSSRNGFTRVIQSAPSQPLPTPRPKSGVRPPPKPVPPPDAFGELEALLDGKE